MTVHGAQAHGHTFAEAFMLMRYRCDCGRDEIVWNSRDQITPFMAPCRCGASAQHIDWQRDVYAPDHVPNVGDRVFVPPNAEETLRRALEYVDRYWETGVPAKDGHPGVAPMKDHPFLGPMGRDGAAAYLAEEWMKDGAPALVTVTEPLRAALAARRA